MTIPSVLLLINTGTLSQISYRSEVSLLQLRRQRLVSAVMLHPFLHAPCQYDRLLSSTAHSSLVQGILQPRGAARSTTGGRLAVENDAGVSVM